jgi:hypothetical protein
VSNSTGGNARFPEVALNSCTEVWQHKTSSPSEFHYSKEASLFFPVQLLPLASHLNHFSPNIMMPTSASPSPSGNSVMVLSLVLAEVPQLQACFPSIQKCGQM